MSLQIQGRAKTVRNPIAMGGECQLQIPDRLRIERADPDGKDRLSPARHQSPRMTDKGANAVDK